MKIYKVVRSGEDVVTRANPKDTSKIKEYLIEGDRVHSDMEKGGWVYIDYVDTMMYGRDRAFSGQWVEKKFLRLVWDSEKSICEQWEDRGYATGK